MGGVVGLFVSKAISGKYSLIRSINCSIAGMVSLCSGCNVFAPWASSVVAAVGALAYQLLSGLMVAIRIDDPVDAIAVHGAGGIVGILSVPLFMEVINAKRDPSGKQIIELLRSHILGCDDYVWFIVRVV